MKEINEMKDGLMDCFVKNVHTSSISMEDSVDKMIEWLMNNYHIHCKD